MKINKLSRSQFNTLRNAYKTGIFSSVAESLGFNTKDIIGLLDEFDDMARTDKSFRSFLDKDHDLKMSRREALRNVFVFVLLAVVLTLAWNWLSTNSFTALPSQPSQAQQPPTQEPDYGGTNIFGRQIYAPKDPSLLCKATNDGTTISLEYSGNFVDFTYIGIAPQQVGILQQGDLRITYPNDVNETIFMYHETRIMGVCYTPKDSPQQGYDVVYASGEINVQPLGIYRLHKNDGYGYYQVINGQLFRIPNEVGISFDPNPPLDQMYPYP